MIDDRALKAAENAFTKYRKVSDHPLYCLRAAIEAYEAAKEIPAPSSEYSENNRLGWFCDAKLTNSAPGIHQPGDITLTMLEKMIREMRVAHDMSHEAFCDGADWKDTFELKAEAALSLIKDLEASLKRESAQPVDCFETWAKKQQCFRGLCFDANKVTGEYRNNYIGAAALAWHAAIDTKRESVERSDWNIVINVTIKGIWGHDAYSEDYRYTGAKGKYPDYEYRFTRCGDARIYPNEYKDIFFKCGDVLAGFENALYKINRIEGGESNGN